MVTVDKAGQRRARPFGRIAPASRKQGRFCLRRLLTDLFLFSRINPPGGREFLCGGTCAYVHVHFTYLSFLFTIVIIAKSCSDDCFVLLPCLKDWRMVGARCERERARVWVGVVCVCVCAVGVGVACVLCVRGEGAGATRLHDASPLCVRAGGGLVRVRRAHLLAKPLLPPVPPPRHLQPRGREGGGERGSDPRGGRCVRGGSERGSDPRGGRCTPARGRAARARRLCAPYAPRGPGPSPPRCR